MKAMKGSSPSEWGAVRYARDHDLARAEQRKMPSRVGQSRETNMTSMSLDNTSRTGSPGPGELVPSRYALRVGEIDALVISDGVFPLPATTLATNADPAHLAAWLDDRLQPADLYKWPLNVVVVRSGRRTVLIDAGMGAEYPGFPRAGGCWPCDWGPPASIPHPSPTWC